MLKNIFWVCIIIAPISAMGQNSFLDSLKNRSEIVAHIQVTKIALGNDWDLGASEVTVQANIIDLYKGKVKDQKQVEFIVITHTAEFDRMFNGDHYIVFLEPVSWILNANENTKIPLGLVDNWFGIQPFYKNLHNKLKLNY